MKFCPKCGSAIMPGNNICINCGETFNNNLPPLVGVNNQQQIIQSTMSETSNVFSENISKSIPGGASVIENNPSVMNEENKMPLPPAQSIQPEINVNAMTSSVPVTKAVEQIEMPAVSVQRQEIEPTRVAVQPVVEVVPMTDESMTQPIDVSKSVEQPITQPNNKESNILTPEEKEKKVNRIVTLSIIAISLIAIIITVLFLFKVFSPKKEESTNSKVLVTTQYSYEGFDFFLPEGVIASVEKDEFIIRDSEETWSAVITIQDGTYNTLVSNKSQLSSYFETYGYVATEAEVKEVSGTSFITTEVLMGSQNVLVAYAKASGTKIYGIVYVNELGTYDNYSLKIVGEVLASAINSGYDKALPEGFTIDMFKETFEVAK